MSTRTASLRPDPADDDLVARLRAAGCVFAEEEARLLRAATHDRAALDDLVVRRVAGEPLEQLLGWVELGGHRVRVRPGVFVPRRRSLALVARAARLLDGVPTPTVVDVACGTGALGLLTAQRVPGVVLHASDVDATACACAADNLGGLGTVHRGDLLDALPTTLHGRVDLVLANLPYVPTAALGTLPREAREHEPRAALDGGDDGVTAHRRLAAQAPPWVRRGGHVLVETSAAQADLTTAAFDAAAWRMQVLRDEEVGATVVQATRR